MLANYHHLCRPVQLLSHSCSKSDSVFCQVTEIEKTKLESLEADKSARRMSRSRYNNIFCPMRYTCRNSWRNCLRPFDVSNCAVAVSLICVQIGTENVNSSPRGVLRRLRVGSEAAVAWLKLNVAKSVSHASTFNAVPLSLGFRRFFARLLHRCCCWINSAFEMRRRAGRRRRRLRRLA